MKKFAIAIVIAVVVGLTVAPLAQGITTRTAYHRTLHYARHACLVDNKCHKYGANGCVRHSGGVSCWAWNYERKRGKYTCKRLVFWRGHHREFLTQWKCNLRGWNWGPNR